MSFMDKAKDAVEKFKNSDNEQVKNVKDKKMNIQDRITKRKKKKKIKRNKFL